MDDAPQYTIPAPYGVARLRRNRAGYPVPFFVATTPNGGDDFRIMLPSAFRRAVSQALCWVCGRRREEGRDAFILGPMCAVNRVTAEPPSHQQCADYAVKVCPFLTRPDMMRRPRGLPEGTTMPGVPILRNPGVALIWTCSEWTLTKLLPEQGGGWLFDLGEPLETSWWREGRPATRREVTDSIHAGLPALQELCENEQDIDDLARAVVAAAKYLPGE